MSLNSVIAFLMGCLALVLTLPVYFDYIYMLGFPDGAITELGYAQRKLARIFITISVIFGLCFICLGLVASRKKVGKILFAAISLYVASIISLALVNYYYSQNLMDGAGG